MTGIVSILMVVVALAVIVVLFITLAGRAKGGSRSKRAKGRESILKEANKRLAQNPRDPEALWDLADLYYQEQTWDKAFKTYEMLIELAGSSPVINEYEANLRYAVSALKLNLNNEAYKGFAVARSLKQDSFEANFNLGYLEFLKKNYEKAVVFFNQAKMLDPENAPTLRYLGHAYFKMKKYKEAMTLIRRSIDLAPDDKESLYTLGECYYELNQTDQALRIFSHLRPDPVMGPNASLFSGTINIKQHQYEKAIEDFEIGLRHQNIKPEVALELKYRLATVLLKQQEIGPALGYLREIQEVSANFKDVPLLLAKYQELNANKNMQIYLMAPSADFVALCRKIVMNYFPRAKVKITNISVNKNEWADLLAEVDTPKWSDLVMFRFIRSQGSVGELTVRDFHSHLKEVKAGKGYCLTVGSFTEEAKRYTEARLIDLIEKDRLTAILNTVDAKAARSGSTPSKR
ncbi:CDC27 family protein [Breznakiella homolactica]|uniref:Tetratricopeptide repeat protein n=1 Tax=Breznakiella homolactica TaxID=2798577 RepID=A0A7T7XQ31_9SPIR|nr:CDC27 family protein [Breznakiella homolactica]QQO10439.1 tetratricopeptide repeat protein [Breznakiella homolactica]